MQPDLTPIPPLSMAYSWNSHPYAASPSFPSGNLGLFDATSAALAGTQSFPQRQQYGDVHPGPPPTSLNSAWLAASTASLLPSAPTGNHDIVASLNHGLQASNLAVLQQQQQLGALTGTHQPYTWSTPAIPTTHSNAEQVQPSNDSIPFESLHHHEWVGLDFQTHAAAQPSALATSSRQPPSSILPTMDDTAHLGQLLRDSITDELAYEALQPPSDFESTAFTGRSSSRQSSDFFLSERNFRPDSPQSGRSGSSASQTRPGQSVHDSGLSMQVRSLWLACRRTGSHWMLACCVGWPLRRPKVQHLTVGIPFACPCQPPPLNLLSTSQVGQTAAPSKCCHPRVRGAPSGN